MKFTLLYICKADLEVFLFCIIYYYTHILGEPMGDYHEDFESTSEFDSSYKTVRHVQIRKPFSENRISVTVKSYFKNAYILCTMNGSLL